MLPKGEETVVGPVEGPIQSRYYKLKTLPPETALSIIKEMLPEVGAVAVPERRALILMGSGSELETAVSLLEQIDRDASDGYATQVFTLRFADPNAVAQALKTALPGLAYVSVQAELRAVTVRGSATDVAAAERMVQDWDEEGVGIQPAAVAPMAIRVQYVDVSALAATLEDLLPAAKITYDEVLDAIFITGTQADLEAASTIVAAIDIKPVDPTAGEPGTNVIFRDLSYATPEEAQAFLQGISTDVKVAITAGSDCILITCPAGLFDAVKELLETFDVPPKEVVIEALVTDMSREVSSALGFAWDFGGAAGIQFLAPATEEGMGFPGGFRREEVTITAVLEAIDGDSYSKLLARPSIRAVDFKEASILIGEKILFQVATIAGGAVTYDIREEEVGINLTMTARITNDGHVMLDVQPEVSTITGFNPQGYPIIATREANTTVRLKDGETLVIGGLIREEEIDSISKVPFLSELPLLGKLFRKRTKLSRPSEVLIMVTPHIIGRGEEL